MFDDELHAKKKSSVRDMVANSMTGILGVCVVVIGLILIFDKSTTFVVPQNIHSIVGLATCLSSSPLLLEKFRGMGFTGSSSLKSFLDGWLYRICPANEKGNVGICTKDCLTTNDELEKQREPEQSVFKSASLSPTIRITVALALVAITTALEVTLRISTQNDGLGNVPSENQYIRYLWTTLPTVIFTFISMYCSSADFDTRSLAPFLHLVQGSTFGSSVDLDLINKHPILLFYEELRSRSFEAMTSTLAVTLTSFLTIFSTGLFTEVSVATTVPAQLDVADFVWYATTGVDSQGYPDYSLSAAALILDANLTYTSFTHEDLVLPDMRVDGSSLLSHPNSSNIEFSGTFSAARPSFANCRLYNSSEVHLDFASWSWSEAPLPKDGISVLIEPEKCFRNQAEDSWNLKIEVVSQLPKFLDTEPLPSIPLSAYFGVGAANSSTAQGCSQWLWAWGQWESVGGNESFPEVLSVSAMGCNESLETVDVSTSLFGLDLAIDPKMPPVANESSKSSMAMDKGGRASNISLYSFIPPLSTHMTDRMFDTFFTLLTTSRYAVPLETIGNGSRASAVSEAIQFHHRVMAAQVIAASRGALAPAQMLGHYPNDTEMREQGYEIVPGTNKTSSYSATGSIPSSRRRVVQDELSTRSLQGLLVAALICCLSNWYFIHSAGGCQMIPRKPNTIANVAALLADGDLIELLSTRDAGSSAPKQTQKRFEQLEDCIFRLGWRETDGNSEKVFCIYVSSAK